MTKMINNNPATIGITMGDPSGIGPEIILKSFKNSDIRNNRIIVIGDYSVMQAAWSMLKIKSFKLKCILHMEDCLFDSGLLNILDLHLVSMKDIFPGKVQAISGDAAFRYIEKAVELAKERAIDRIVTAPLNKEALHAAGHTFPGHTEILATLTNTRDYAMLLHHQKLSVVHVSTHVSLIEAITGLRRERIETVIELGHVVMEGLCAEKPRIAVAGLNPHAGENGLFGQEEMEIIVPAVQHMKAKGIDVEGPLPPDTVFLLALKGKYDLVVAMYHDQGHIPLKLLGFDSGVNVTVGLPFVRTSVDHGTAFEIAWKGKANEISMVEAIKLSIKLN